MLITSAFSWSVCAVLCATSASILPVQWLSCNKIIPVDMTIAARFIIVFLSTLSIYLYYSKAGEKPMFFLGDVDWWVGCVWGGVEYR